MINENSDEFFINCYPDNNTIFDVIQTAECHNNGTVRSTTVTWVTVKTDDSKEQMIDISKNH